MIVYFSGTFNLKTMPNPKENESKEEFVKRFMSSEEAKKDYPDRKKRLAVAYSKWSEHHKNSKELICTRGLKLKEDEETGDIIVSGLVATTHPDRVGDILSEKVIDKIVDNINDTSKSGGDVGSFRSVSLFHDWVKQSDPTLDEAAFLKPTAKKVYLQDGHYGAEVEAVLNKYYHGDMGADEIKYRIDNGQIAGFSIEYDTHETDTKLINYQGNEYRFVEDIIPLGGVGFARARMIANPQAVIYK